MPFPATPKGEDESLFRIDDPFGLRRAIIPLFSMDRETHLVTGLGTAFRVDPFGTYLTAHHVLECSETGQFFTSSQLGTVFGLFNPGLVLGCPPIPKDCFVFVSEIDTFRGEYTSPLIHVGKKSINAFDCTKLLFDPKSLRVRKHKEFLPLQLSGKRPQIGDRVMAIGYAGVMDVKNQTSEKTISFTEGLHGAVGEVTNIFPAGRDSTKPWPTFEVSCKWPGGMSGGPVFNEEGHIIGMVSYSLYDSLTKEMGVGYTFWFQPLPVFRRWLPYVDTDNAGLIRGWGVIRTQGTWHLAGIYWAKEQAEEVRKQLGSDYEVRFGSHRPGTDDFISIELS